MTGAPTGRRAEIAGGGLAGLTTAILLARRGWSVRVHERNDAIREVGAGIFLRHNPFTVLEGLGIMPRIYAEGVQLERGQMLSGTGRLMQDQSYAGLRRLWIARRQVVIRALEHAAIEAGVEIRCSSRVAGCDPAGVLRTTAGEEYEADLVIGADGHNSPTRESLGLTRRHKILPTLATRYIVPNRDLAPDSMRLMYWSGRRRVGTAPCDTRSTYVYMISPVSDLPGKAVPIDVDSWGDSFPVLRDRLAALHPLEWDQHPYVLVQCRGWHVGRVAVIGDAAHAQPPTLGQGAGMALTNACTLAHELDQHATVPEALAAWEAEYRPVTETTQRWSVGFDAVSDRWPRGLLPARNALIWSFGHIRALERRMRASDGIPLPPEFIPPPRADAV
jgi:2-polyprenyl-6-methoxyphenol hydroxylase-like FAD-dependent oxidoreductase